MINMQRGQGKFYAQGKQKIEQHDGIEAAA